MAVTGEGWSWEAGELLSWGSDGRDHLRRAKSRVWDPRRAGAVGSRQQDRQTVGREEEESLLGCPHGVCRTPTLTKNISPPALQLHLPGAMLRAWPLPVLQPAERCLCVCWGGSARSWSLQGSACALAAASAKLTLNKKNRGGRGNAGGDSEDRSGWSWMLVQRG